VKEFYVYFCGHDISIKCNILSYVVADDYGTSVKTEDSLCIIWYSFYPHNHVSDFLYTVNFLKF
jgi:hypothetical protein